MAYENNVNMFLFAFGIFRYFDRFLFSYFNNQFFILLIISLQVTLYIYYYDDNIDILQRQPMNLRFTLYLWFTISMDEKKSNNTKLQMRSEYLI